MELGSAIVDAGQSCPPELAALAIPGKGYVISVDVFYNKVIKRWTVERKASVRKKRLLSRLDKKFPLFKDEFYQRELEARPDYFKGT